MRAGLMRAGSMREVLNPWLFVGAAYLAGVGGTAVLAGWSWWAMRRAEARRASARDVSRER